MGWEIYPDHLYDALTRITRDYGAPEIYITENGAALRRSTSSTARSTIPQRTEYLRSHLDRLRSARSPTASTLRGYFCWSLLDNFEWSYGYSKRFGIVYVDFATQQPHRQGERPLLRRLRAAPTAVAPA